MNSLRPLITIGVICLLLAGLFFVVLRPSKNTSSGTNGGVQNGKRVFVLPPESLENGGATDSQIAKEKAAWVHIVINNQVGLYPPHTVLLPTGWIAREDYLVTVLPNTMNQDFLMQKTIIMRPPQGTRQGREDAIYSVPEISDPYFKPDRCMKTSVGYTCYGGDNPITKHVFEVLFR